MLEATAIEHAVDLQRRSYRLLRWMTAAIDRGFIRFDAAHDFASLPAAARVWLDRHHNDLPRDARPELDDIPAFANLYATYLEGSFDLAEAPGKQLYSRDHHCYCFMCSWLVDAPRLRPKKPDAHDKRRADKLQERALAQLGVGPSPLREEVALVTYAFDLLGRLQGHSEGAATLVLWRRFAWTPEGSPRKGFELTARAILDAEARLLGQL